MNFIKKLSLILIIFVSMVGVVSSQSTTSVGKEGDYRDGYNYGEEVAKEDALKANCSLSKSNAYFEQRKYLGDLKQTKSKAYVKGFLWGYEASYSESISVFCPDFHSKIGFRSLNTNNG